MASRAPVFTCSLPRDGSHCCPPILYSAGDICGTVPEPARKLGGQFQ